MTEVEADELRQAVEQMHGCRASLREVTPVIERFKGQKAWDGTVHVFALTGHPTATVCYAWSSPIDGSERRRFYAVLHSPPVASPLDAVRAAIITDYKSGNTPI